MIIDDNIKDIVNREGYGISPATPRPARGRPPRPRDP